MDSPSPRLPLSLLVACALLLLIGWGGVIYLTSQTLPTIGPRWLFFAVWLIALTGTAIPFAHYLNKRFAKTMPPDSVMLRQSVWFGLFGGTCAWLQLGRALNWASFFLVAAAFVAIEGFLLLRERSRRPPFDDSSTPPRR